ncbi:uncharacterized protein LOC135685322 isoform X2 [Rhopilema esculentum]|uniref:uncharacterized protein LOC135685322 isoform X2 n=1 Tax=Rhopilema esculentum TaxID=499914 RepID=UPI0031E2A80A
MARRHAIGIPALKMKDGRLIMSDKARKPSASPSSSFIGSMLMKATIPIAYQTDHERPPPMERYRLLVVGDNTCGKTSLLNSFVNSDFEVDESDCGIFDECITEVLVGTKPIEFMLWDLSGHEEYDGFRIELFRVADIFLVCFDIGDPESFENVEDVWIPEIKYVAPETPFILVGCKNDLRTDASLDYFLSVPGMQNEAQSTESVCKSKAEKTAVESGAAEYIECCAKTRFNITEVFKTAGHVLMLKNDPSYSLQLKSNLGFLSKYSRRKSTEVGDRLQLKKGKLLFTPERNGRRGSMF